MKVRVTVTAGEGQGSGIHFHISDGIPGTSMSKPPSSLFLRTVQDRL